MADNPFEDIGIGSNAPGSLSGFLSGASGPLTGSVRGMGDPEGAQAYTSLLRQQQPELFSGQGMLGKLFPELGGGLTTSAHTPGTPAGIAAGLNPGAPNPKAGKVGNEAFQFFLSKGMSPKQAAGMAGNFAWESGGSHDAVTAGDNFRNSPNSPHSAGIGQWNDRLPELLRYARENGINLPEGNLRDASFVKQAIQQIPLKTQLEFAWKEMQGSENRAFQGIKSAPDNLGSTTAAAMSYHRPAGWTWSNPAAGHGFANRAALAHQIYSAQNAASNPFDGAAKIAGGAPSKAGLGELNPDDKATELGGVSVDPRQTPEARRAAAIDEVTQGLGPTADQVTPMAPRRVAPSRPSRKRFTPGAV